MNNFVTGWLWIVFATHLGVFISALLFKNFEREGDVNRVITLLHCVFSFVTFVALLTI